MNENPKDPGTATPRAGGPLDATALASAAAAVSALAMLLLGVFGAVGVYEGAVEMMEGWHLFFRPTVTGTAAGMIEAAVVGYVLAYVFARLYNAFLVRRGRRLPRG